LRPETPAKARLWQISGGGFGRPLPVENLAGPAVHQGVHPSAIENISGRIVLYGP
jgi:hypothetical protein